LKGARESYNLLKKFNLIDPWTLYYVIDNVNNKESVVEYFGRNIVNQPTGQVLPVNDILSELPSSGVNPYDRYLVGDNENGYKIYEYTPISGTGMLDVSVMDFDWKYGVRVLSKNLKNYVYYSNKLITYDDVDCGEF
jgi:hypothetical protein